MNSKYSKKKTLFWRYAYYFDSHTQVRNILHQAWFPSHVWKTKKRGKYACCNEDAVPSHFPPNKPVFLGALDTENAGNASRVTRAFISQSHGRTRDHGTWLPTDTCLLCIPIDAGVVLTGSRAHAGGNRARLCASHKGAEQASRLVAAHLTCWPFLSFSCYAILERSCLSVR